MFEEYGSVVTSEELGEMLRIGSNQVYKILNGGEIQAYKEGRVWRISKEAVIDYVRQRSGIVVR